MIEKSKKLFEDRLSAFHYFWATLILQFIFFIPAVVLFFKTDTLSFLIFLIPYLLLLPLIVRRLHDIGWTGKLAIIGLAGYYLNYVSIIFYLILIFKNGTDGKNKYGEKPSKNIKFIDAILNRRNYSGDLN